MKRLLVSLAAAALCAAAAAPAAAQDYNQAPAYGTINLVSGFQPDPYTVNIQAGGNVNVAQNVSGCTGFVATAPDYRVNFTAGRTGLPLIFSVASNADTTLVVNGPNAQWFCDDDGGVNGLNPQVRFNAPRGGQYDIWIGTYSSGSLQSSTLFISEISSQ